MKDKEYSFYCACWLEEATVTRNHWGLQAGWHENETREKCRHIKGNEQAWPVCSLSSLPRKGFQPSLLPHIPVRLVGSLVLPALWKQPLPFEMRGRQIWSPPRRLSTKVRNSPPMIGLNFSQAPKTVWAWSQQERRWNTFHRRAGHTQRGEVAQPRGRQESGVLCLFLGDNASRTLPWVWSILDFIKMRWVQGGASDSAF